MSFLGTLFRPIFEVMAGLIAFYYGIVHSYAFAIALLTVTVMVVVSPLTYMSTKSMLEMQKIQPMIKALQQKYKGDRQGLMEAQQALFKEHKVSPAAGCLPMVLQLPILYVMYDVIRGLTNTVGVHHLASPKYIGHSTLLYKSLIASDGAMHSLGLNLALKATASHGSVAAAIPYFLLILVAVGLQYLQMSQITNKNPAAAQANRQAYLINKFSPLIFGVIYINIPSGVNIYFIVASLFRIAQQEVMYRFDPAMKAHAARARLLHQEKKARDAEEKISGVKDDFVPKIKDAQPKGNQSPAKGRPSTPNARSNRDAAQRKSRPQQGQQSSRKATPGSPQPIIGRNNRGRKEKG